MIAAAALAMGSADHRPPVLAAAGTAAAVAWTSHGAPLTLLLVAAVVLTAA